MNIDELLDLDSETWKPEPGDKLVGQVVALNDRHSDYGDDYPVLTVQNADGIYVFHAFHTVARNGILDAQLQPGDQVGIKYKGTGTTGAGNEFHNYAVVAGERAPRGQAAPVAVEPTGGGGGGGSDMHPDEEPFTSVEMGDDWHAAG